MRAWRLALVALVALAQPARGAELEARVQIGKAEVTLHEQVLLHVEVTHPLWARPRWEPPVFEGFWSERLSSVGGPLEKPDGSETFRRTTFRRALFPTRAGRLTIGPSLLRYRDRADHEQTIELPGTELRVLPLPQRARPDAFQSVVGQLQVDAVLSREVLELGQSLSLSVEVYGAANTWDVPPPDLEAALGQKVEVFPNPARTLVGEQGGKLTARRSFGFELVPRETGRHQLPPLTIHYFDPQTRSYRIARSQAVSFRVVARGALGRRAPWQPAAAASTPARGPWLAIALIVGGVGTLCAWGLARWWRRMPRTWQGPTPPSPRALFEGACAAFGSERFPDLLTQAVKARIHVRHQLDARPLSSEEIAGRIDDEQAVELLRDLDRARFGRSQRDTQALLDSARRYLGI